MDTPPLLLRPEHLNELLRLLRAHLPDSEVWAYGSRVNGDGHDTSDLDLAVRHPADLRTRQPPATLRNLRAAFSESNLPFLVDLHDWAALPPEFHPEIIKRHIILQPSKTP
jgi:predicted nucleotidyltransferase